MRFFQAVCICLLAVSGRTQEVQNCSADAIPLTVGSTEDAGALATSILGCSDGNFAVQWVGEVLVEETIRLTGGASLDITGAGSGVVADGGSKTQLFYVDEGSTLHLSDMTLANGNASIADGGAIFVNRSNVSLSGNVSFIANYANKGGAIFAENSTVWLDGDGTEFSNNSAGQNGGAVYSGASAVLSWDGDGTEFSNNSANVDGGAIYAYDSTVSWGGNNTQFISNAAEKGGAIYAEGDSTVSWDGDSTHFMLNTATDYWDGGGAICTEDSTVSWGGDSTQFISNSASHGYGGAIFARGSSFVYWDGDSTRFVSNAATQGGGAIYALYDSIVSWDGTEFSNNSAGRNGGAIAARGAVVAWRGVGTTFTSNSADSDGGAVHAMSSMVSLDASTVFRSNIAGENGGALAVTDLEEETAIGPAGPFSGTSFIDNSAGTAGGAIYLSNCEVPIFFTNVTFQSNSANGTGGAVAAFTTDRADFSGCTFLNNRADDAGGAIEALAGDHSFTACEFVGNSADVGGAMRLCGSASVANCSFLSNSATSRGPAVSVVASANITGSSFDRNELRCEAGSFRKDTEQATNTARFETVCFDCPGWGECSGCTIERGDITPTCEAPIMHTTASEPGLTMETLHVDGGYWRATNDSDNILTCYNADACSGGVTGTDSYCASGYTGPYCAVCETDFSASPGHICTRCSTSRRQGLMAATVITALLAVVAVVAIFKYLLSTDAEEENIGWFHRRVYRAVPVQALKIVVVVWQILTQFADAASVSYPGVYQDFLSVIDFINFDLGSALAAGCLWADIDFHDRLVVSTVGPLVVIGFLAITYRIAVRRNDTPGDTAVVEKMFHKHLAALLLLTFLVYSSVSSTVFQTFACETLDDGIEYLRADYRIRCTDAEHKAFAGYAIVMVFVYPVGIPMLYAVLLFQCRGVLAHADTDKAKAQSIAGLWEPYKPDRFYYEVVECGRRVMLTGVVVFIFPNDAAQIAITLLIAFFFLVVFEILSPYKSESDMWLSRVGHVIVFLSMFDLLLLKVDVSGERDQSQAAFAGVLVAGHALMMLAIVVEVIGICHASGKKSTAIEASSEGSLGSRPPARSDMPVFERAPSSWRSFLLRRSVSEQTGPTRSVSETVITTVGRP